MADDITIRSELRPASSGTPKLKRFQTVASGAKGAFTEFKKEEEKGRAQTRYAADEFTTEGVGTKAGLYVWRIENLKPVAVMPENYGKFYTGDSYVLLYSKQAKNWLVHAIHFWLGKESTIDETGAAAYKTVELEERIGGQATQRREVQGHESDKFMSYFPDGVMYMSGGVESAFVHVDKSAQFEPRLLHVKGRKNIRSRQVPITRESLNDGDVFILDTGSVIFQFNGKGASRAEKAKAAKITQNIKDFERGGKARLVILNQDDEDRDNLVDWVAFWDMLGGKGPIAAANDDDEKAEVEIGKEVRLYHVSDAKGSLEINLLPSPISKRQLNSMDAYILDCKTEIFVWIGKGATQLEKNEALAQAKKFLISHQRPPWTPLTRILEGSEPVLFIEKFPDWPEATEARARYSQLALLTKLLEEGEQDKKASQIDVAALIDGAAVSGGEDLKMDSGSHKLAKTWVINGKGKKKEVEKGDVGKMYEGNCYIIDTTYKLKGEKRHAVYVYYGRRALAADRAAADKKANKLAKKEKKVGPGCVVLRMEQGRSDSTFVSLFCGALVTLKGDAIPRRRVVFSIAYNTKFGESIYVCGNETVLGDWKPEQAVRLSWDNGVWRGAVAVSSDISSIEYKYFTSDEYNKSNARWESCKNRELKLKHRPATITVEVEDSWDDVNPSQVRDVAAQTTLQTQLFHIRGTSLLNTFAAETVPVAASLNSGDSFVLRAPSTLYVWFGSGCNAAERKLAHMAARVLRPAPDVDAVEFDEGSEPQRFWDLLGGKAEYSKPALAATAPPARLFHAFNSGGKFQVREITDFSQSDFFEDDVMILDAYSEVFVWYGSGANELERRRSLEIASQYAAAVAPQRPELPEKRVVVVQTFAGAEPPAFIAQFQSWDADIADPYTKRLRALQKAEADAVKEGKDFIAKTLEYTGELEERPPPAVVPAAETAPASVTPSNSGSIGKAGASSDLALEAAASVAARAAEGGAARITTTEDANAAISGSLAERKMAEQQQQRAAANAAAEAEENANRAVQAQQSLSETQAAAKRIAEWEAGQSSPSAEDRRASRVEERSRARASSIALTAAEADARRKADQERADAINARLKAEREAKAAADAKAAAEEAANPKMSIWDRAAAEEREIQREIQSRLTRTGTASQLRAAEAVAAIAAAAAEERGVEVVAAAPAPAAVVEPVAAPPPVAPRAAELPDPSSLFAPAVEKLRQQLAKGQVRLVTESIKILKGNKDYPGTNDTYKSALAHTRRDIGEAVLQVQEDTSSAAFGVLRGASQEQRSEFGRRLKAFVALTNEIAQGSLPYLQNKLITLNEWARTDEMLLAAIRSTVASSFAEYEARIVAFAAEQSITLAPATAVSLPTKVPTASDSSGGLARTVSESASSAQSSRSTDSAPLTRTVSAAPSSTAEDAPVKSAAIVAAENARREAEAEEAKAAEERRIMEEKLREKRAQVAALQARVSSQKLISSPAPPEEGPSFTASPTPTIVAPTVAPTTVAPSISVPASAPPADVSTAKLVSSPGSDAFVPYAELRKDLGGPPRHCDPTKLESYLSDAEFKMVFKMDRAAFYAQKDWMIRKAKTNAKLW